MSPLSPKADMCSAQGVSAWAKRKSTYSLTSSRDRPVRDCSHHSVELRLAVSFSATAPSVLYSGPCKRIEFLIGNNSAGRRVHKATQWSRRCRKTYSRLLEFACCWLHFWPAP